MSRDPARRRLRLVTSTEDEIAALRAEMLIPGDTTQYCPPCGVTGAAVTIRSCRECGGTIKRCSRCATWLNPCGYELGGQCEDDRRSCSRTDPITQPGGSHD